jgi:hypothetical protein
LGGIVRASPLDSAVFLELLPIDMQIYPDQLGEAEGRMILT